MFLPFIERFFYDTPPPVDPSIHFLILDTHFN